MCGITGIMKKRNTSGFNVEQNLLKMADSIKHRGPDDYAQHLEDQFGMAMRRLAILDLTPGLYPFTSSDKKLSIIFNGEIYNFLELREELKKLNYRFSTDCDAEVILNGYIEWGNEIFKKLRGMFAVVIWNLETKKLILVRDRVGIKPIYYVNTPEAFLFSSEAKAFYQVDKNIYSPSLNYENIELLLGFMFLPKSDETLLNGIKKLPPATILEIQGEDLKFTKFWDINDVKENTNLSFSDAVDQLNKLLVESVRIHLLSDAPLGMLLSGGIDSSLLTAIMVKEGLSNDVSTFTAKFDHKFNESNLAKKTAEYLGTKHTEYTIDISDLNNNIENYVELFDDLTTFDGGILTTKLLCGLVNKTGIKVLLLGEGSDEIFGGYSWFGLSQFPFNLSPAILRNLFYYYSISRNITINQLKYANYWNNVIRNTNDIFRDITKRELLVQLPNHLLMKVDKGSMASSIEARVPYLDHVFLEFVYSLPQRYKLKGSTFNFNASNEKYILREVAKRYLPNEVVFRKKRGFLLPMGDVLAHNKSKIQEYVRSPEAVVSKIFDKKTIENLFKPANKYINMQNEYFQWRLFILEAWASRFKLK